MCPTDNSFVRDTFFTGKWIDIVMRCAILVISGKKRLIMKNNAADYEDL